MNIKKNKIDGSKLLLNILSGAIGEINKRKITIDEDDDDIEDIDFDDLNLEPIKITYSKDFRYTTYTCVDKDKYFKSNFARFKPFLWAHARLIMSKLIKPINHIVKKCITDGIITTEPIECFNKIGTMAYEHRKTVLIQKCPFLIQKYPVIQNRPNSNNSALV